MTIGIHEGGDMSFAPYFRLENCPPGLRPRPYHGFPFLVFGRDSNPCGYPQIYVKKLLKESKKRKNSKKFF